MNKVDSATFDYHRRLFASINRSGMHPEFYFLHLGRELDKKRKEEAEQNQSPTIKHIRRRILGVDQVRLAKLLSVTRQTVSGWESQNRSLDDLSGPKRERLERLIEAA